MHRALRSTALSSVVILAAMAHVGDARACGGCFQVASESTVVTAHRMAFAVSSERTILWDQIQYSGAPSEFAWALPVRPGATVELSTDAWFETLDSATTVQTYAPQVSCGFSGSSGCTGPGCFAAQAEAGDLANEGLVPPVTVVHQGTVGPYETVTLHADVPNALADWLTTHGFAIDPSIEPVIDAYVAEGFDFIALRLQPGQGVSTMKPVRVVSPGATPTLPLRMVAAGTGPKTAITLFVIGEGRWEASTFPNALVNLSQLFWDFTSQSSNYAALRDSALATNDGRTWITTYAKQGTLFSQTENELAFTNVQYSGKSYQVDTIAAAYAAQAIENDETTQGACTSAFLQHGTSESVVSGACLGAGTGGQGSGGSGGAGTGGQGSGGSGGAGTGGQGSGGSGGAGTGGPAPGCEVPAGAIDARELACGPADDIAAALVGMHPRDVWITRLEANLPRAALADDLTIAAADQDEVNNLIQAPNSFGDPCGGVGVALIGPAAKEAEDFRKRNRVALAATAIAVIAAAIARRSRRSRRSAHARA